MAKRTPPSKERQVLALALQPDPPSLREMGTVTGLNHETVRAILRRNQALLDEYRRVKKDSILEDLDALRQVYLSHLADPTVIDKTSGAQAAVIYGILTEKYFLEAGRPTSITLSANVDATMPDLLNRLRKAIERRGQPTRSSGKEGEAAGEAGG